MERYLGIFLIITVSFLAGTIFKPSDVLGENIQSQAQQNNNPLPAYQPIETKSSFTQKLAEQTEIIPKKIVWKNLDTPDGSIQYWKKLKVYATHYDSRCLGCNEWTAIGMRAGKGVIAVDPKIIPMRSKVYIPGYGVAIAGDTGGAIKGNIIDLGFDDAKTAGWKAHFIDIYLL